MPDQVVSLEEKVRLGREKMKAILQKEFAEVGGAHRLMEYFTMADPGRGGYVDEATFRRILCTIFQRARREAPAWAIDRCVKMARAPFEDAAVRISVMERERAARSAARKLPPQRQRDCCDYRFFIDELGL
jgi:hypothetical protein